MEIVLLPPHVEAEIKDCEGRAHHACLHRQTNEFRQQGRSLVKACVGFVKIVDHACCDDDVVNSRSSEPYLQEKRRA